MTDKESDTGKFFTNYRFEYPKENVVVATSSFEDVPSNKKRLINLTMNGILRPSEEKLHEVKMIFEGDVPEKDRVAQCYGTFVLCKGVYNARKIVKTLWDQEKRTLTVIIDLRREKVRVKRPAQFSFTIQINDSCRNPPPECSMNLTTKSQLSYSGPCNCGDNERAQNGWNKTAWCYVANGCGFAQEGNFLQANNKCNLPGGSWRNSCQVRKKFKQNGKEYIKIVCAKDGVKVSRDCTGDWGSEYLGTFPNRKTNTKLVSTFYAGYWDNNDGTLTG
jgi:hypothetical protein